MNLTRRKFVQLAATAPLFATSALRGVEFDADSLQAQLNDHARLLGLPGFVAGVVHDGELSLVQAEGFANLESKTHLRRDHIFSVASVTKTFTAVMLMQYVQEKKISLEDYVLDFPFLSVGFTPDRVTDANLRLKHVMSHTSEGRPGDNYVYNGGRYNFTYGVFEEISGNRKHYEACALEFQNRIAGPLGLAATLCGFPIDNSDPRIPRITTQYFLDSVHKTATRDQGTPSQTILYPSTGLLSTVDDLAKYMIALDENTLLSAESYERLTTPFQLNDGRHSPYGLGWSTQEVGGHAVHWHYGFGDSYSALLIRIPNKKMSFIFLSNTGAASAPFLLGYGNVLTSPFAVAFLDCALPAVISHVDKEYARMFSLHYVERIAQRPRGEANMILKKLRSTAPDRFQLADWAMIRLLTDLGDPEFSAEMQTLVDAYRKSKAFHPDVSLMIADYYGSTGDREIRDEFLHQVADSQGYGEAGSTRDACVKLGTELLQRGTSEQGRQYLWKAARYAQTMDPDFPSRIVQKLQR